MVAIRPSKLAFTSALVVFPLIVFPLPAQSAPERIHGPIRIEDSRTVTLKGHVPPQATKANDRGPVEAWTPIHDMRLVLDPSPRQSAELAALLEDQRDPSSPNYHNWLTPEQYGERFGLAGNDLEKMTEWLQTQGFTVERVARAKNWITFSGYAGQLRNTFATELHRYRADGEMHFATATEPTIPASLDGVVTGIQGLDDFRPKPPRTRKLSPDYTNATGSHYLAPDDLATIYDISALYQAGFDGTGQKLVIPGQTDVNIADIRAFRSQFNLAANDPQLVLTGTDPGARQGDNVESTLDIEWSGAVARNAKIIFVYSQNVFESVQYAIDENLAPVISLSYGGCELGSPTSYRTMAQQANAEGITWMSASGDSGAAGCDSQGVKTATNGGAVTFPADIPEVTAVGGTEFNEGTGSFWSRQNTANWGSATSYIPEKAWNDTNLGGGIEGSGGGASQVYAKPSWQSGPGVPNDNARDLPDVSLSASGAHDGYIIYVEGGLYTVGGTSASTPSFAGIVTLINHYVVAKGVQSKPGLGNINPTLYSLAQSSPSAFHDITVGGNIVPCASGSQGCVSGSLGYQAGPGYDQVTGLGSVDAYNLVTNWATLPTGIGTTTVLSANPASIAASGTTQLTATVKPATGANPATGSVTFSAGNTILGSATLTASGTPASNTNATATLAVKGTSLASGANTITATYAAAGNFANSTATATVTVATTAAATVGTTTTLTANPTSITPNGTTLFMATVKPASGTMAPTGSIKFAVGTEVLTTEPLTPFGTNSTAGLTVTGNGVPVGAYTFTAGYVAIGNFAASTASTTLTVTSPPAPVATTTTVLANPTSIASTATTQLTATVKAASGAATPAGSIAFALGKTSLGSATLSNGSATLTVKGSSLPSGANAIVASYTATGNFANSTGSVTVTVSVPVVATTTTLSAAPASILSTGTTVLAATVQPPPATVSPATVSSAAASPTGSVTFAIGNKSLGSATVSSGRATLTIQGASLTAGSNTISANYTATGNFSNSAGTTAVNVTVPSAPTAITATATPTSIASTAIAQLTATVKGATGSAPPTGNVSFSIGNTLLGTAALITTNGISTATLTLKGSSLATGSNLVTVTYAGNSALAPSTNSVTVSLIAPTTAKH